MKIFTSVLSSIALACSASAVLPSAAQANEGRNDGAEFCRAFADANPAYTVGGCMSAIYGNGGADRASICKNARNDGLFPLDVGGGNILRNVGDCVGYLRGLGF